MAQLVTNSLITLQTLGYSQKLVCLWSVSPRYSASVMGCLPGAPPLLPVPLCSAVALPRARGEAACLRGATETF